jgi:hypothetical protein
LGPCHKERSVPCAGRMGLTQHDDKHDPYQEGALAIENRRELCHQYGMAKTEVGGTPIVVVSSPGVRGKQRWVAAVPLGEMVAEVRKRVPDDAVAELSNQHLSQEQAAKLNLRPGDVRLLD